MTDDQGPTYTVQMEKWRDFLILVHHLSGIFVILLIFFFCAQSPLSYLISHPFVIKGMSFFFLFFLEATIVSD
jgi:hypothetical protein